MDPRTTGREYAEQADSHRAQMRLWREHAIMAQDDADRATYRARVAWHSRQIGLLDTMCDTIRPDETAPAGALWAYRDAVKGLGPWPEMEAQARKLA